MASNGTPRNIAVVGGGLAGLTAAAYLARDGHRVSVYERSETAGGRARTREERGLLFNQGPHALYQGGEGVAILEELGVTYTGRVPNVAGAAIRNGRLFTLPVGGRTLMTTRMLGMRDRVEAARLLLALRKAAKEPQSSLSISDWLDGEASQPGARQYIEALMRLTCYANAPETISLSDAAQQFANGAAGVRYLDGGWKTLVEGLRSAATEAGASVATGAAVREVARGEHGWTVRLANGQAVDADMVVLAVAPDVAAELVAHNADLRTRAGQSVAARAACLDVAVSRMPSPRRTFGLGIDVPVYYSVHTKSAQLAPDGVHIVSAAKYLPTGEESDPEQSLAELEAELDLLQPGWRAFEVGRQFLPEMVVTTSLSNAAHGGLAGRPGPELRGEEGLFVAGDWVGDHGWLADAALGSAREAAGLASAFAAGSGARATMAAVS